MQYFWDHLESYGNNTALISERGNVSYKHFAQIADRIAEDVPERSLVFMICGNHIASVAGYIAFLRKRVAVALLSSSLDDGLFDNLLRIYKPHFIWCPDGFTDLPGIYAYGGYKLVATGNDRLDIDPRLAVMVTTSGSTGSPKFVRLSYENIASNTAVIAGIQKITSSDRVITSLPMQYVYGLSFIQSHLMAGAGIVLTDRNVFDKQFWDTFKDNGVTAFGAVPYTYQMLDKLHFLDMDLPSLRYFAQAGGKLSKDLHYKIGKALRGRSKDLLVSYGASEATSRMSYVPFDRTVEKAGSIGIAIPGGRFELIDPDRNIISESNTIGELVYYGPNVMLGYAQTRDDLNNGDEMHGRLATGDLAQRDSDGFYYIAGRKSRFLKIFGNRVNLSEIEDLLGAEGYDAACAGEDDHILIYTASKECREIVAYISKKTGIDPTAFTAITIAAVPRNEAGKILYSKL